MADETTPRRLSLGYVLFGGKPFKGQPPPRPPPKPLSAEAVLEWTASDGRKNTLTGAGKQRLTAATLARVPSERRSVRMDATSAHKNITPAKAPSENRKWQYTKVQSEAHKSHKSNAPSEAKKSRPPVTAEVEDVFAGIGGAFDTWNATTAVGDNWRTTDHAGATKNMADEEKKGASQQDNNSLGWSAEDDKKLMDWKNEHGNERWAVCAETIGKPEQDCKTRFKTIKPKDWRPPNAQGSGGRAGKKDKHKNNNSRDEQARNSSHTKDTAPSHAGPSQATANHWKNGGTNNKTDEGNRNGTESMPQPPDNLWEPDTSGRPADKSIAASATGWLDGTGGAANLEETKAGSNADFSPGSHKSKNSSTKDNNGGWNLEISGSLGGAGDQPWDKGNVETAWDTGDLTGGGDTGDVKGTAWDADGGWNNNQDGFNGDAPLTLAKSATKSPSHHSAARTHRSSRYRQSPGQVEITPDETFTASDLRLIARILQQDASLVWNRVSWRFRDKTGKQIHPDVFEDKITGRIESKGSESGYRHKKQGW